MAGLPAAHNPILQFRGKGGRFLSIKDPKDVAGLAKVIENLAKTGQRLDAEGGRVVELATLQCQGLAQKHAPRDPRRPPKDPSRKVSGHLKDSIHSTVERDAQGPVGFVYVTEIYGVYQELGSAKIGLPARPYLRPAHEQVSKTVKDAFRKGAV